MSVIMKFGVNLCVVLAVFSFADALTFPRKADLISRSSFFEETFPVEDGYYDPFTDEAFGGDYPTGLNDAFISSDPTLDPTLDPTYFYPDPSIPLVDDSQDTFVQDTFAQDMFAQDLDSSGLLLPLSEGPSDTDSWMAWRGSGRIDENEPISFTSIGNQGADGWI